MNVVSAVKKIADLKIEPMASTPVDELVPMLGPTLQRYLTASGQ
ncbi:TetR/AcrR family transcriptional regulator [Mycobacterium sp. JS623]|nr:hypothetical protein [Mycobacterium sp. JS623]